MTDEAFPTLDADFDGMAEPDDGPVPRTKPDASCDVIMKGGITSGVIYPRALSHLGRHYRLRGLGGASAGAIGAALGAAAEYGRAQGGFDTLGSLPAQLRDGKLARLFQPQRRTRKLLDLLLTATGADGRTPATAVARVPRILGSLATSYRIAGVLGALPGVLCIVVGATERGLAGWLLVAVGILLAAAGWTVAVALRVYRQFTVDIPANQFGICTGLSTMVGEPGFTDWLSTQIDVIAGLQAPDGKPGPPLTFGDLWADDAGPAGDHMIDLRLITTCLNQGKPYEMPFEARTFFFKRAEWERLFPLNVIEALTAARAAGAPSGGHDDESAEVDHAQWQWEDAQARVHGLIRLPAPQDLPVIVAVRMSLSFPLLISAVPLYTIDRRDRANRKAVEDFRHGSAEASLSFTQVWFTDGGFCSNFPVNLFDRALPTRPTFAINLGQFPAGEQSHPDDPLQDIEWSRTNNAKVLPPLSRIPETGVAALAAFGSAAFNTARNWNDSSYLNQPGHRDRIIRVNQTKLEGGLNLHMDSQTIDELARRGEFAARAMHEQFNAAHFANGTTGWDNHRWVRYRALLAVLPGWLRSFRAGYAELNIDPKHAPSYPFGNQDVRTLADELSNVLIALADRVDVEEDDVVDRLTRSPNPRGSLRRIPDI